MLIVKTIILNEIKPQEKDLVIIIEHYYQEIKMKAQSQR